MYYNIVMCLSPTLCVDGQKGPAADFNLTSICDNVQITIIFYYV